MAPNRELVAMWLIVIDRGEGKSEDRSAQAFWRSAATTGPS